MKSYFATTLQARCRLAASYVDRYNDNPGSYWIAYGKSSAWADDSNPPYPALTIDRVPELLGFSYVHSCEAVYPTMEGYIQTPSQNYAVIQSTDPSLMVSAKATKVYFESLLQANKLEDVAAYRIRCLCTDVTFTPGYTPSSYGPGLFVLPEAVASYFVDWTSHSEPIINDGFSNQVIQIVREF